jgi:hypothetical protein
MSDPTFAQKALVALASLQLLWAPAARSSTGRAASAS